MKDIDSNSMDMVVHTFMLCSVENYHSVLDEIYRVLKPGGLCVFIEHSLNEKNKLIKFIQKVISPFWFCLMDCRFIDMKKVFGKEAKYDTVKFDESYILGYLSDPVVFGYGTKHSVN